MTHNPQGIEHTQRYHEAILRTLTFITHQKRVLLLKGSPNKRLWPNQYNGIGGHVEPGESILEAAQREAAEETRLSTLHDWTLRGITTIQPNASTTTIVLFIFTATSTTTAIVPSNEGELTWFYPHEIPRHELVTDLPVLLPYILDDIVTLFFAHYTYNEENHLTIRFTGKEPHTSLDL